MATLDIRELIQAGFHFGHRASRWNPSMKPYIFKKRNLIHIIDLRETLRGLIVSRRLTQAISARGEYVMFAGTKKQASGMVIKEATRCGMPYVAERWPGGLLTNYVTVRKRLDRLDELEGLEATGQIDLYSKKMVSTLRREKRKILRNLGGVRNMDRLPGLIVVVDPVREHIAIREARKLDIPIIALTDTDGDPEELDVVVPGNDDSIAAVQIFLRTVSDAVLAGTGRRGAPAPAEAATVPEEVTAPSAEEPPPAEEEPAEEPAEDQVEVPAASEQTAESEAQ